MTKTLPQLEHEMDELQRSLGNYLAGCDPLDHSDLFAGMADEILKASPPEHRDHVWSRLQCIQRDAGLIPGDDEPCSD
jgi:hypothetical protein